MRFNGGGAFVGEPADGAEAKSVTPGRAHVGGARESRVDAAAC